MFPELNIKQFLEFLLFSTSVLFYVRQHGKISLIRFQYIRLKLKGKKLVWSFKITQNGSMIGGTQNLKVFAIIKLKI